MVIMIILMFLLSGLLYTQDIDEPLRIEQYADGYLYTCGSDSLYVWWMPGGYPIYIEGNNLRQLIKEEEDKWIIL